MAAAGVLSYSVRDSFNSHHSQRVLVPRAYPTSSAMSQSPGANTSHHRYLATSSTAPNEDSSRMSLPSISNLLGIADASRPESSQGHAARNQSPFVPADSSAGYDQAHSKRPRYDHGYNPRSHGVDAASGHILTTQDHGVQHRNTSSSSYTRYSPLMDAPPITSSSVYSVESDHHGLNSKHAYNTSPYSTKPYAASPSAASDGSVYSPNAPIHRHISVYGAQGTQPGYVQSATQSTPNLPTTNPWEHHHYISSSAQQGIYPPLPDRYICQTCNKAFSRPSSLKIHSHSHTGEKPFKCPHAGCGKAFSVKSNMKRHEKGCHTSTGQAMPGAYMDDEA